MSQRPTTFVPVAVVVILAAVFGLTFAHSNVACQGHAILCLDDPYIHLALARNLAVHGTWGVNPGQFSATSSSPLYTLAVALAFMVAGPSEFWVWLFCVSGAIIVALILAVRAAQFFSPWWLALSIGLWALITTGLPELMFTGMEHTWHMAAVVTLAAFAERRLVATERWSRRDLPLVLVTLATSALRYETLFLIPPLVWLFFGAGRRRVAIAVAVASVTPAIILGIVQLAHGAMFLPNTILLKGVYYDYAGLWSYTARFIRQIGSPYWVALLAAVSIGVLQIARGDGRHAGRLAGALMFISGVLCQAAFGLLQRRYVGYLAALGIWVILPWAGEWLARARAAASGHAYRVALAAAVIATAVFPFAVRFQDLGRLPDLGRDIYEQQYQMARFFATYYRDQTVAVNDVGLVAWAGQVRVLDLWGLGNEEIARWRVHDQYTTDRIREITGREGVDVVACYPSWFVGQSRLPAEWRPVGYWQVGAGTETNVGSLHVFFYPARPESAERLRQNLVDFAPQLPPTVKVGY